MQSSSSLARVQNQRVTGVARQVPTLRNELAKAQARLQTLESGFLLFDPSKLPDFTSADAQMKLARQQLLAFKRRCAAPHRCTWTAQVNSNVSSLQATA